MPKLNIRLLIAATTAFFTTACFAEIITLPIGKIQVRSMRSSSHIPIDTLDNIEWVIGSASTPELASLSINFTSADQACAQARTNGNGYTYDNPKGVFHINYGWGCTYDLTTPWYSISDWYSQSEIMPIHVGFDGCDIIVHTRPWINVKLTPTVTTQVRCK